MAAHFVYLCGGLLPSPPTGPSSSGPSSTGGAVLRTGSTSGSSYGLLGCEITSPRHRNIADCVSFTAFRVTEVLEWAIWRAEESGYGGRGGRQEGGPGARQKPGAGVGTIGRSLLTGLFNLGGVSSKGATGGVEGEGMSDGSGSSSGTVAQCVEPSRFVKMRAALCPHKLRVAMTLADLGNPTHPCSSGSIRTSVTCRVTYIVTTSFDTPCNLQYDTSCTPYETSH